MLRITEKGLTATAKGYDISFVTQPQNPTISMISVKNTTKHNMAFVCKTRQAKWGKLIFNPSSGVMASGEEQQVLVYTSNIVPTHALFEIEHAISGNYVGNNLSADSFMRKKKLHITHPDPSIQIYLRQFTPTFLIYERMKLNIKTLYESGTQGKDACAALSKDITILEQTANEDFNNFPPTSPTALSVQSLVFYKEYFGIASGDFDVSKTTARLALQSGDNLAYESFAKMTSRVVEEIKSRHFTANQIANIKPGHMAIRVRVPRGNFDKTLIIEIDDKVVVMRGCRELECSDRCFAIGEMPVESMSDLERATGKRSDEDVLVSIERAVSVDQRAQAVERVRRSAH